MKKLATFFMAATLAGCFNEEPTLTQNDLIGVWFQEDDLPDLNRISRLQYQFKNDNSVEILRMELQGDTRTILGYRFRSLGSYSLSGNHLNLASLVTYGIDDSLNEYVPLENLKLIDGVENSSFTCRLDSNGKELSLILPPCGPLENCVSTIVLRAVR